MRRLYAVPVVAVAVAAGVIAAPATSKESAGDGPKGKRVVARAAAATGCVARAQFPSKANATDIYGYGTSTFCDSNTAFNQVTVVLEYFNANGVWQKMGAGSTSTNSSHAVGARAWYTHCKDPNHPVYGYRTVVTSYSKNKAGTAFYNTMVSQPKLRACKPS